MILFRNFILNKWECVALEAHEVIGTILFIQSNFVQKPFSIPNRTESYNEERLDAWKNQIETQNLLNPVDLQDGVFKFIVGIEIYRALDNSTKVRSNKPKYSKGHTYKFRVFLWANTCISFTIMQKKIHRQEVQQSK